MPRVKIQIPETFPFSCSIPVRVTDINYGGHVGNDSILSIIHEARMQFLNHFNYSELSFAGVSMIMADVAIEFKAELFYGDTITAFVKAAEFSRVGFDLFYKLEKTTTDQQSIVVAVAKTGMICYDYERKAIVAVPQPAKELLGG